MTRADVPRLYAIADRDALGATGMVEAVRILAEEGVGWIQIRAKGMPGEELRRTVDACLEVAASTATRIWVDDRVDVTAVTEAAGVHLGQDDLTASAARATLGAERWVGRSTHGLAQAAEAAADDAVDLVAVGPIHPTTGKRNPDPVVGLDLLKRFRPLTEKPIVAIGGLSSETAERALEAGADTIAVLGAVCRGDVRDNARRLLAATGGRE